MGNRACGSAIGIPHIASCADDLCMLRSCVADGQTHVGSVCQMNTGSILAGRPSLGAWALYGLGSESENLPGFVVLTDYVLDPPGGQSNWGTGFMPATYQGTRLAQGKTPILGCRAGSAGHGRAATGQTRFHPASQSPPPRRAARRRQAGSADRFVRARLSHAGRRAGSGRSFDRDCRDAAPIRPGSARDRAKRPQLPVGAAACRARRALRAALHGRGPRWDAHTDVEDNHAKYCRESDRPIAGLLKDLKRRGLLDSTLVIWGGEFGRTPMSESGNGRDHNPFGFTMWMAGGGVKPGLTYGATDEIGLYAVEDRAHLHDIHATILHLMGLNHEELTYPHNGREERLTITEGIVMDKILA